MKMKKTCIIVSPEFEFRKHLDNCTDCGLHPVTLTVEELASALQISRHSAYMLTSDLSFFPCFKEGRKLLISYDSLQRWIDQRCASKGGKNQ